jgi:Telomerase ribonucleoprotein complex - RNA binding domain
MSRRQVYRFIALVTKAVIPKPFWGGAKNFKLVMGGAPWLAFSIPYIISTLQP